MRVFRSLLVVAALAAVLSGCTVPNRFTSVLTGSEWVSILGVGESRRAQAVAFCDLPQHEGALVRVQAIYSGVEEYWGLSSTDPCDSTLSVNLDAYELATSFDQHRVWDELRRVQEEYWRLEAVVDVVGTFESGSEFGYGHLGSNDSQITAKALRVIEVREHHPPADSVTAG